MPPYVPRLVDPLLDEILSELPAVFVTGPRGTGKTTTAARRAATVIHLDREADATAFRADPDAALRGLRTPVLLDEWQVVPGVLGAIKRAVDTQTGAGRFLVTGSVRSASQGELWPGTGRIVRVPMTTMTVREQHGGADRRSFLDRVVAGDDLAAADERLDLRGYLDHALRSGFPEPALGLGPAAGRRWLDAYVEHLLTRDAEQIETGRDPVRLGRYLEAYALNTAGVVTQVTLIQATGIDRRTAHAYERLLADLLVVDALPAWTSNRLKRLVLMPKRHIVDTGLLGSVLRLDTSLLMRRGDLLGRVLESFVVAQIRAEVPITDARPRLYHVRQQQGRLAVDLLAELSGGRLVAIEIKADAGPDASSARHLATLRDQYPDDFIAGIVLHTGPRTYRLGDRIVATPISTLWA